MRQDIESKFKQHLEFIARAVKSAREVGSSERLFQTPSIKSLALAVETAALVVHDLIPVVVDLATKEQGLEETKALATGVGQAHVEVAAAKARCLALEERAAKAEERLAQVEGRIAGLERVGTRLAES